MCFVLAMATRAQSDVEAQVDAYLGSLDAPIKLEQWRALGPEAVAILERKAFSADELPTLRARAAEALGLLGHADQATPLTGLAGDTQAPLIVRIAALRAAGRLVHGDALATALSPLLEKDHEPHVRAAAADVLAERLGAPGCALVQRQLKAERAIHEKLFASAVRRCKGSAAR
jgi:HEAT repeat protein